LQRWQNNISPGEYLQQKENQNLQNGVTCNEHVKDEKHCISSLTCA
jgi:hypothetical protein